MADRFSDSLTLRVQPHVRELVVKAAGYRGMMPSEYVRQAVLTGLRLDGFDPGHREPQPANAHGEAS